MRSTIAGWFKPATYQPVHGSETEKYHDSESARTSSDDGLTNAREKLASSSRTKRFSGLLIHSTILVIYTTVYLVLLRRGIIAARSVEHKIPSPAWEAVEKVPSAYQQGLRIVSPYQGEPSPELDQAWSDLLQYSNVMVSGEDLRRINKTSIPYPGEDDTYWVQLGVSHELHCIKRLRHYWFSDYYYPNITDEERRLNWLHNDHCLEILRQSVMCHADVSLVTMEWKDSTIFPTANFHTTHECTNWDKLYEWQKSRARNMMEPGLLVHPKLGVPYPDGEYDGPGVADPDHAVAMSHEHDMHE